MSVLITGKGCVNTVEKFCRLHHGLEYVGKVFSKYNHLIAEGEFIKIGKYYYVSREFNPSIEKDGFTYSTLLLTLVEDFSLVDFILSSDCPIRIKLYDDNLLGFQMSELKEAQKEIKNTSETEVNIWVQSKHINKDTFMNMTT